MPERVQRKRTKGWRMPENTVYVGRPTKWGNPYSVGDSGIETRRDAAEAFSSWLCGSEFDYSKASVELARQLKKDIASELRGENLACWCRLDQPCHADVLLRLANQEVL